MVSGSGARTNCMSTVYLHVLHYLPTGLQTLALPYVLRLGNSCEQLAAEIGVHGVTWGIAIPDYNCIIQENDIRCIKAARMVGQLIGGLERLQDMVASQQAVSPLSGMTLAQTNMSHFCRTYLEIALDEPNVWILLTTTNINDE